MMNSYTGIKPPDAITRRVHESVRAQRTTGLRPPLRNAVALIIASSLTLSVIAAASLLVYGQLAFGLRAGVESPSLLAFVAIALLSLLLTSTFVALWRGRSGLGASTTLLIAAALATAPLYALLVLLFPVHGSATTFGSVNISPWGARCFFIASFVGLTVLACFASAMRAAAPVGAHVRSMALGSAAGSWAGVVVFAFCPSGDALHVSIGHLLPVIALTVVGAVTLPRILRP